MINEYFTLANDSPSGIRWKVSIGKRMKVGDIAGSLYTNGYYYVRVKGKRYRAHRVVAVLSGLLSDINSPVIVDHKLGLAEGNNPSNLRVSTHRQNQQNRATHRAGALVGAHLNKRTGKWSSSISIGGQAVSLGTFTTADAANAAYLKALEKV